MKRKPNLTPEQRAARAELMRRNWQDPAFRARRAKGSESAWERDARTGARARKIAEANREQWKDPATRRKRLQGIMKSLDEGGRERRAAQLETMRNDPVAEAKRLARVRDAAAKLKSKRRAVAFDLHRKRRGFDVPARLWADYVFLRKRKGLPAREAGIALGLVRV